MAKKFFTKSDILPDKKMFGIAPVKKGHIDEAERLANAVIAGLESENYAGMNRQLSEIAQHTAKEVYVYEHPDVTGKIYSIIACSLLSMLFAYFLLIGTSTAYFSVDLFYIGVFLVIASCAVLIINFTLIYKSVVSIRYKSRFDVYEEVLGHRNMEFVEDISSFSNQTEKVIIDDLNLAVKKKLIPQGHFSKDNLVFMVSDKIYSRYLEKPAVYDHYFQKIAEGRRREKSRTKRISEVLENGNRYIEKLQGYAALIKDRNISKKIGRMEKIVSMIFHEIDVNPDQIDSLGVFLNYYLPTTDKLLDAYVSADEKGITGKTLKQTKKEIEDAINTITTAFEGILNKLYEEHEMDISSDISALELSMKQEGLHIRTN